MLWEELPGAAGQLAAGLGKELLQVMLLVPGGYLANLYTHCHAINSFQFALFLFTGNLFYLLNVVCSCVHLEETIVVSRFVPLQHLYYYYFSVSIYKVYSRPCKKMLMVLQSLQFLTFVTHPFEPAESVTIGNTVEPAKSVTIGNTVEPAKSVSVGDNVEPAELVTIGNSPC